MQVTETRAEGLSRQFKVTIGAAELDARLDKKLKTMAPKVKLKGFRPGKVPVTFLKKTYGKSMMGEVVQETVSETSQKAISERELRTAAQPRIEFGTKVEDVIEGSADLEYTIDVDLMPDFEPAALGSLSFEREVAEVADKDITEALERIAETQKSYKARKKSEIAKDGDQLTIDFKGTIDGEPFEGGAGEDVPLVLGAGRFLKEFEEQLAGVKTGAETEVKLTFPADYPAENLQGKEAVFAVTVKEVAAPEDTKIDDDFAKKLGLESLDKLNEVMKERLQSDLAGLSRAKLKRKILDKLDELHSFELPPGMVDNEFEQIWRQVEQHLEDEKKSENKSEDELRADYRKIAERRVRLGLVLAEVGRRNSITVTQEELGRAMAGQASQYPGQEQQLYQFYRNNPQALDGLRAPIFEDKVIDFIIEMATVTDKTVSKDDLTADDEGDFDVSHHDHDHDHGHVHGPDCDHDH